MEAHTALLQDIKQVATLQQPQAQHGASNHKETYETDVLGVLSGMGLALAGGIGYSTRSHGLTTDNIISTTIVLANGSIVRLPACLHMRCLSALQPVRFSNGHMLRSQASGMPQTRLHLHSLQTLLRSPLSSFAWSTPQQKAYDLYYD